MAAASGKVALALNGQATARMLAVAFFIGGSVATAVFAALVNTLHLGAPYPRSIALGGPYFDLFLKLGTGIAVLSFIVVKLRQPRGASIEWNDWGVIEWDGDAVRCAIPRAQLRVGTLVTKMQARGISNVTAQAVLQRDNLNGAIGMALTIGDEAGRRIYVGEGTQLAWLGDRLSSVSDITELRKALSDVPGMPPELGRGAENRLVGIWLLGIIAYVTAGLAALAIAVGNASEPFVIPMLAVAALFGLLRTLIPLWRASRIKRAVRALSEPVTLQENEGPLLVLRTVDGQTKKIDPRGWKHPDGGLELRRGAAYTTPQYDTIETAAARSANKSRLLALRIEFWGRMLLPIAMLAMLVVQLQNFEKWKQVAAGEAKPIKSAFLTTMLLRDGAAQVEIVYETGKKPLDLHGPAEIFTRGPDGTLAFQKDGTLVFRKASFDGQGWDMTAKKGGAKTVLPRARLVAASNEVALIIAEFGEGQLWKTHSIDLEFVTRLPKPLDGVTTALVGDETLFVGMEDGSIDLYALNGEAQGTIRGETAPVRGLAADSQTLAVATNTEVTFFDVQTKTRRAKFGKRGIVAIDYGYYPSYMHESWSGLLVLTADGSLSALDSQGIEKRHFNLHLPAGEQAVRLASDRRSVLVATNHGALYELWIH